MMLKQHVSHKFMDLSPEKKVISYQANHDAMSPVGSGFVNNSVLYSYAIGQTQITAINSYALAAESGNKVAKSNLKKAVKLANITVSYWALIVDAAAMGDETIIKNAAFTPTSEESTPSVIFKEITLDYDVQKGTGNIYLKIVGMKGKSGFINYYTGADMSILTRVGTGIAPNVAAIVTVHPEVHKHILISGLPSNTIIQAVCTVTNTAGTSQMTNIVKITVP